MCKQTGTKGDTICDIELGNNPARYTKNKCIIVHPYIMTEKLNSMKDDKQSNENSHDMPTLQDYKSKEE